MVPLFRGFTNWLVHDGEKRIDRDIGDGKAYETYLDHWKQRSWQNGFPRERAIFDPFAHGGLRELLLLHTMGTFFGNFQPESGTQRFGATAFKGRFLHFWDVAEAGLDENSEHYVDTIGD